MRGGSNEHEGGEGGATPPRLAVTLAAVLFSAALFWPIVTVDMGVYLVPWLNHVLAHGPIGAFAAPFSNYTPPYLYLLAAASPLAAVLPKVTVVKALSVLGTLWLAFAVRTLLRAAGARADLPTLALLLALPSVLVNAALFGQCDALWSGACAMAVAASLERRPAAMLVWCGVAVAIKAQAVFLAPFVLAWLFAQRVPLRLWAIPAGVFAAMMLPAWLAGWPAGDLATVYLRQASWSDALSMNAPNLWTIVQELPVAGALPGVPLAFAAAGVAALAYVLWLARLRLDRPTLVAAALLSALMLPGLLPKMHERFFFLAVVLAFAFAAMERSREAWRLLVLVEAGATLGLAAHFTDQPAFAMAGAAAMLLATVQVAVRVVRGEEGGRTAPSGSLPPAPSRHVRQGCAGLEHVAAE